MALDADYNEIIDETYFVDELDFDYVEGRFIETRILVPRAFNDALSEEFKAGQRDTRLTADLDHELSQTVDCLTKPEVISVLAYANVLFAARCLEEDGGEGYADSVARFRTMNQLHMDLMGELIQDERARRDIARRRAIESGEYAMFEFSPAPKHVAGRPCGLTREMRLEALRMRRAGMTKGQIARSGLMPKSTFYDRLDRGKQMHSGPERDLYEIIEGGE